jgi:hypothetical protein|uniref:Uncharacterized protein n=1 Tax=viral metagenome TaxID=1070528 RepID=A0A6C0ED34_9ZZZZ
MNKKILKNGGFPPLLYCPKKNLNDENIKERSFSSSITHNINIRQILSNNKKPFILDAIQNTDEQLEIITPNLLK